MKVKLLKVIGYERKQIKEAGSFLTLPMDRYFNHIE